MSPSKKVTHYALKRYSTSTVKVLYITVGTETEEENGLPTGVSRCNHNQSTKVNVSDLEDCVYPNLLFPVHNRID